MHPIDYAVILSYFAIVIGIGLAYRRLAARNLDSYFLGGKSMHWLAMAMSGSVSTFDITGTMWIVTLITLFGFRSMWNHWMWGFLMAAFFMSYMGKWVRRSGVMTGAEWMMTRFGNGPDGKIARFSYTLMAVVTLSGFVGYAFQGIGKFAAVYVDLAPAAAYMTKMMPAFGPSFEYAANHPNQTLAVLIIGITTLYVLLGGLYSVVITNVIQTLILTFAAILIAGIAYAHVTPEMLAGRLSADFTSILPVWQLPDAQTAALAGSGYEVYHLFGALVIMWVVKGLLLNLGGPGQMYDFQLFLATRDARDASKLGAAWSGFLIVRWAMCMGIALLALTGLIDTTDPEQAMPLVLQRFLGPGLRGLVIAGLMAAFMSTFGAVINAAASYVVRDLWQPLFAPDAGPKQLVRASYVATISVVLVGIGIGMGAESIRQVWDWIMMALGAAFVVPNVLRWYWWRLNGWGYAVGTLLGLIASLVVPWVPTLNLPYIAFPIVCIASTAGCLAATWLTRPTSHAVLVSFFEQVRPFGLWGPIRSAAQLSPEEQHAPAESARVQLTNVVLAGIVIVGIYLAPMYLVGHWHTRAAVCLAIAAVGSVALYFTWYRNLPEGEGGEERMKDEG